MAIRFLELEVYCINESEISKRMLFDFFLTQKHTSDIVLLTDEKGLFTGIITYKLFIDNLEDIKSGVQHEFVYFNEDIWDEGKKIIKSKPTIKLLPVLNASNVIEYFCYNDTRLDYLLMEIYEAETNIGLSEFRQVYPTIELVEIHDMNEISYKFCEYLVRIGVRVKLSDEKWSLGNLIQFSDNKTIYPKYHQMHIYSEGTASITAIKEYYSAPASVTNKFECIRKLVVKHSEIKLENMIKELRDKNVLIKKIHIPEYNELSEHTLMEDLRFYMKKARFEGDINKDKYLMDVYGKEMYEWYKEGGQLYPNVILGNGHVFIQNQQTKYINVVAGKRVTTDTPDQYENEIHIFGPCTIEGRYVMDKDTIPSILQKLLLSTYPNHKNRYRVVNHGKSFEDYCVMIEEINQLEIKENDMILIINLFAQTDIVADYSLINVFNRRSKDEEWFADIPAHTSALANKAIAEEIMKICIEPLIKEVNWSEPQKILVMGNDNSLPQLEVTEELIDYLNILGKNRFAENNKGEHQIGSIVMNCNPFTLGHQYLIEKALEKVDYLYVFVVEEDKSHFSFSDRMEMVKNGTRQYKNIKVLPSGKYILSTVTMPEYFEKDSIQDAIINATEDVGIFGEYIVPLLDISVRFVGEEPFDKVTRQYNEEMKRILPKKGVEVIEIPRLEVCNHIVSASEVRKLLREGNLTKIQSLVPGTTYNCLKLLADPMYN